MQRWMFLACLGIFGLMLLAGGSYWGLKEYRLGKPGPRWVPLPLNYDVSAEKQSALAGQIEAELRSEALLRQVVVEAKLVEGFGVPDEEAALAELKRRMFVRVGTTETPTGKVPSINIGLDGTRREREILDAAAMRLMREVWRMMGVDLETGKFKLGGSPVVPAGRF